MPEAVWKGQVIASSDDTVVVEGNHYFPPDSVNREYLADSDTTSTCHWKGEARYYSITVDGDENRDAAWYYHAPLDRAKELGITDYVAFWKGVQVR